MTLEMKANATGKFVLIAMDISHAIRTDKEILNGYIPQTESFQYKLET